MAKTRKQPEKKSEDIVLRRTRQNSANASRPSIVLPIEKSKSKASSATTATKTRAKNTKKNEQLKPKPKEQKSKAITVSPDKELRNRLRKSNQHGDLLASMKPLTVRVGRLFNSAGELPNNYITNIIQRDWKRYAEDTSQATTNTKLKGIEYIPASSLKMQKMQGVYYAFYPVTTDPNVKVGAMMIKAGGSKKSARTGQHIRFTVLCGKAELKSSEIHEHFGAGDVFSIPPNVKYSLKNESSEPCYLNFFSYPQNADDPK